MPHSTSRTMRAQNPAAAFAIAFALLLATTASAPATATFAWHLAPAAEYASTSLMTHVVSYDMNGALRAIAGSRADATTILEQRVATLAAAQNGAVDVNTVDTRRYGGDHPKDASVVSRTMDYKGTMTADGTRTPTDEPLVDAGDGALAQLPKTPLAVGQSWGFARKFLVEREMGQGTMNYTDTLSRIDVRGGHQIAVIDVKGEGRADVASDLQAKGFRTAELTLTGTAEFDLTAGLPGVQHYTAHAEWSIRPFGVHVGVIFDDTYDATAWSVKSQ